LPVRRNNIRLVAAAAMVLAIAVMMLIAGCGKKDDPACPAEPPPLTVFSVAVQDAGGRIRVNWNVGGDTSIFHRIRVFRSAVAAEGTQCPAYPREFLPIADVPADDASLVKTGGGAFSMIDASVKEGFIYSYRVVACAGDGRCTAGSESVEILIGQAGDNPQPLPQGETK